MDIEKTKKEVEPRKNRVFDHENFFQRSVKKQNLEKLKQKKHEKEIRRKTEKGKISENSKMLLEQRNFRNLGREIDRVCRGREYLSFRDFGEVLSGLGFLRLLRFNEQGGRAELLL